ncbi:hypothetical protein L249_3259 [Ophiocordyceps polyrhachis-furcata BCC 54312]|uniref:Kinetochore protein SPC25 n=1 Tax=Ophiocordyceps polyrhachis-furcata BCC 54312 TaxID=1330021 RepID=A0A367LRU8_9HYPO|nr:hypothetical protein L249_3259 [Ophiocordyceps polyrhachis-furcata BCC 54312]
MATTFEPCLSSSISRQSLAHTGVSAADSLPSINFGFDDLRERMAKFSAKFDAFIEHGRKRVLEERAQFRLSVAELQEDQRMKRKDMEIIQVKMAAQQQTMEKEEAERREMEAAIASLESQRDAHIETRERLKKQIAQTQSEIDSRLAAQRTFADQQEAQARFNVPELDFWITNLCLKMEGAGQDDRLKFVYSHVDERNWEREAWFELVTSKRDYDVRHCRPKLDRASVEKVLDRVNESRELVVLLKGMRDLFVEAMKAHITTTTIVIIMPGSEKHAAAQQAVDILHEISIILNTNLDRRTLSICISMIERGVNPEALAQVIRELRQEAQLAAPDCDASGSRT